MSQWSEKISKENLSKTVSSTRYLLTPWGYTFVTSVRIQINNFRKSSKKFIINLLTKNVALNLSGAIFFVGLGYSLKWWYKDQPFVVLLKQNLPALSESQQNTFWGTGESILNDEYQTWTPLIDRIDLYANHVGVKFKQPWQKHVYEQLIGVFGEPAQANVCKEVLRIPFTEDKEWWKDNTSVSNDVNKLLTYTFYTPEKPIFRKKWFKLSPRNLCFLDQRVVNIVNKKTSLPLQGLLTLRVCNMNVIPLQLFASKELYPSNASLVRTQYPRGVKGYELVTGSKVNSTDELSYPLQLTKELIGWQPSPNALILNSYLDEIPYKLENALQCYFPKKDSQLLSLSTSFRKSINSSYPRFAQKGVQKLEAGYCKTAGVETSEALESLVFDSSRNYKTNTSKTENDTTRPNLELFKEISHFVPTNVIQRKFLMSTKQSETYLKKLHFFETKKLLQNQFASLINSFPIDFVEKFETIVKKDKHSHTETIGENNALKNLNGFVLSLPRTSSYPEEVIHTLRSQYPERAYPARACGTEEAGGTKDRASEMGNESNLFETNNDRLAKYPEGVRSNHHLADVTKKVLAVKRVISPDSKVPYSSQLGKTSRYLRFPNWLQGWGLTKSCKAEGQAYIKQRRRTEANKLAQLFTYSTVTNAADTGKIKQLDPLLLLNTLGFTFNNFSPLTNPPIFLSYDKLGVLSNGVTNISKPFTPYPKGACEAEGYWDKEAGTALPKGFFFAYSSRACIDDKAKHTHHMRSKKAEALHNKAQEASVSFYFNPKNLNWVVFQQSTNRKFNLLLKTIVSDLSYINNKSVHPVRAYPDRGKEAGNNNNSQATFISPLYPSGVLGRELRSEMDVGKHRSKEGACLATLLLTERERGKSDASSLAKREYSSYPEGVIHTLRSQYPERAYPDRGKEAGGTESEIKQLIDLLKTNRVINKVDKFITISNGNKINFKQKETKFETLNKINVVDKGINFDKNSRYMSGYVYPDIQSNSLKAHLYQWFGKNKNWLPWFSSHYLNNKPIGLDSGFAKNLQTFYPSTLQPISLAKRGYGSGVIDPTAFTSTLRYPFYQLNKASSSLLSRFPTFISSSNNNNNKYWIQDEMNVQNKETEGDELLCMSVAKGYAKCKSNVYPYGISSSLLMSKEKEQFLGNNYYMGNIEVPYKKFNHYLAKFPGFSDSNQFFTTLPQISCGNENLVNESHEKSTLGEFLIPLPTSDSSINEVIPLYPSGVLGKEREKVSTPNDSMNIIDKSEINKVFIQKNGCNFRKLAYSGIVVQRNKWTKDFQPFKDSKKLLDGASKSSIWGKLFLGPENPLTDRQCHFFGQKQLSTLDTNSLQRDYLRQLGKEILTQSNSKGYTELSKFSSIERTKILSLSKKVNSFFFKKRKYSYLLEPKDQWHLLFQEQLYTALEDYKKYPLSTSFEGPNTEKLKLGAGRIKVSAPLVMARFPKKLVHSLTSQFRNLYPEGHTPLPHTSKALKGYRSEMNAGIKEQKGYSIHSKLASHQLEEGISWRPFCHLQKSSILKGGLTNNPSTSTGFNEFKQNLDYYHINFTSPSPLILSQNLPSAYPFNAFTSEAPASITSSAATFISPCKGKDPFTPYPRGVQEYWGKEVEAGESIAGEAKKQPLSLAKRGNRLGVTKVATQNKLSELGECFAKSTTPSESSELPLKEANASNFPVISIFPYWFYPLLPQAHYLPEYLPFQGFYCKLTSNTGLTSNSSYAKQSSPSFVTPIGVSPYRFNAPLLCDPYGVRRKEGLVARKGETWKQSRNKELEASCSNFSRSKVTELYPVRAYPDRGKEAGTLQRLSPYPLFTERFSEEINSVLCRNKNSLFYFPQKSTKNMRNNWLGIQNLSTSLLIQEPLNWNSWAVLNQWIFLIALLFWVEQTLLNNVFPALFALEQILLSAAGLKTGENNRTHVLRISKNETPKFQNLAGINGLLGELSELVLFLRGQRNLGIAKLSFWNKCNKKNSYGVLLTGSPGTGKTFLVRALANEAKVPVLILSASTLTANKLNNNKPSWSIRHAFKRAKQLAPCILFIDEIDALGKSRGKIVTDINEIVADTNSGASASLNASFLGHKRMLTKSTLLSHSSTSPMGYMFSYEQLGQNCSNFTATLLNKWEYPLQSTILQEFNEINQNSLCQEKLVDLLKIAGRTHSMQYYNSKGSGASNSGTFTRYSQGIQESAAGEFSRRSHASLNESTNKTKSDDLSYSRSAKGVHQLPTLEKEMTRGKFGPLTQLLVSMDGVSSFSGVLIMGATNRPELLDPALTRPGRFEKILRIDKPSEQNRIEILQLYSQNLGVQQQIPWSYLATRTIGLTTADLAVAMNYSSLRAIIQDSVHTLETIEYGLNCITRF